MDIQQLQRQSLCQFCSSEVPSLAQHILLCPVLSPSQLEQKPTFFRIAGVGNICKRCGVVLSNQDWALHRKNQTCKQPSRGSTNKSRSRIGYHSLPQQHLKNSSISWQKDVVFSEGQPQIHKNLRNDLEQLVGVEQEMGNLRQNSPNLLASQCINIVTSILAPMVRKWIKDNQAINTHVATAYLSSAVTKFGLDFFQKPLKTPTWSELKKAEKSINWVSLLGQPQNIFNEAYLDEKLSSIGNKKLQARIIRALNKLSKTYEGMIKRRQVPTFQRKFRSRSFIRIKDLFLVLRQLFKFGKQRTTHLALDLYIIILSGQRFLADHTKMQQAILEMIRINNTRTEDSLELTFPLLIGKTGVRQEVCLNRQLVLLLIKFKWQGFHSKTLRIVQRMSEWLGVTGYCLKDCILNAAAKYAPSLELPQRIAGHSRVENTRRYTRESAIGASLQLTSRLVIPSLRAQFGSFNEAEVLSFLDSFSFVYIRYTEVRQDWQNNVLVRLYGEAYQNRLQSDTSVEYALEPTQFKRIIDGAELESEQRVEQRKDQMMEEQHEANQEEVLEQNHLLEMYALQNLRITVYGIEYLYIDNRFLMESLFSKVISYHNCICQECHTTISSASLRYCCVFCNGYSHIECLTICSCIRSHSARLKYPSIPQQRLQSIRLEQQEQKLLRMPAEYLRQQMTDEEKQIQILLATRRFRYTRVAVQSPGYQLEYPENYWGNSVRLYLKQYENYINGSYWPPIECRAIRELQSTVYGTEFGIYATEFIEKGTFIAQYSCDMLNGKTLIGCKKNDSIMLYSQKQGPNELYLAPKDFCGVVLLINSGKEGLCNCKSFKAVINDVLRIVIYTIKSISAGEELLYDYGETYKFVWKDSI